ncbi:MAG: hypothetical protein WBK91_00565 [Alphaproteobacteria bacterium]
MRDKNSDADAISTNIAAELERVRPVRLSLTNAMRTALITQLAAKGEIGTKALMTQVAAYEKQHGLNSTGLTAGIIEFAIMGTVKTIAMTHWKRINLVLEHMPDKAVEKRTPITEEMRAALITQLDTKGGIKGIAVMQHVSAYERMHGLENTGVSAAIVNLVISGKAKTIATAHWERINLVLKHVPDIVVTPYGATRPEAPTKKSQKLNEKYLIGS